MSRRAKKRRVSIWVGKARIPPEIDVLKELCGVKSYNLDDQEINVDDESWKQQSIENLLAELSYSESFSDQVIAECKKRRIAKALYIVAQFDFEFDPKPTAKKRKESPEFLGVFDWNEGEQD